MRLWKKISIICVAILIVVGTISYGGLAWYTEKELVRKEVEYQQKVLNDTLHNFTKIYYENVSGTDSEIVKKSLATYLFGQEGNSDMLLYMEDELLYSVYDFDPRMYLEEGAYCKVVIDGEQSLILKSQNYVEDLFEIYLVVNIQDIYDNLTAIFQGFFLANVAVMLLGIVLIILAVRLSLRPLKQLEERTKIIAAGDYSGRIDVKNRDEIGNLSEHFNQMTAEIEGQMMELTDRIERQKLFIGAVSHEYKTPITAMLLHIDMLQNMYMDEARRTQSLDILESQCEWLEELTQKLLQITTLNQNQEIHTEEHSIETLFMKVAESTEGILREKQQVLITNCGETIRFFDMDLLHSALVNLIVNGSRASEIGQEIHLTELENGIMVQDFGKGMEASELEKITEPFYRVDTSRNRKTGGLGLGLALVDEIVKVHGGRLEIESKLQKGTTVTITFS